MRFGVYSDVDLRKAMDSKVITSEVEIKPEQVQPSSIDLTLGNVGYCLPYSSIPGCNSLGNYFEYIKNYRMDDISKGVHLHKGQVYVVRLNERLNLQGSSISLGARANPKSSIGRTDIQVRLITDGCSEFDNVNVGYNGGLWLEIIPRSFDIKIKSGIALNQLRIFNHKEAVSYDQLMTVHKEEGLVFENGRKVKMNRSLDGDLVHLTCDLSRNVGAYVARNDCPCAVDLTKRDNPFSMFFSPVYTKDKSIILNPNSFYIMSSNEEVNIPKDFCCEMGDVETSIGEFRAHYAGFFDPGFRARAVLEVRNHGMAFMIKHKQPIASMIYYPLVRDSEMLYGTSGSNYQGQNRLTPAKFFDRDK
jgi:dCTP deaminase